MPQSLARVYVHVAFSTLGRQPTIGDPDALHRYIGGICRNRKCPSLIVGGVADHVHILLELARTEPLADIVKEVKRSSSIHMKQANPEFAWQSGYGAFSVGRSEVEQVREYIRRQPEHHAIVSFQDEFRALLQEFGMEWDERYVWD
ncbi:MAG: transposase [Fimbriimonadaceae bacterium]|nr:transposase [Fimbriimonadaceae bacterium]